MSRRRPWPAEARLVVGGLAVTLLLVAALSHRAGDGSDRTAPPTTSRSSAASPGPPASSPAPPPLPDTASTPAPAPVATPPSTSPAATVPPTTGVPPVATGASYQLGTLVVSAGSHTGYRRALFGNGWDYDGASGCSTRERVLIAESLDPPEMGARCAPVSGRWRSDYDAVVLTLPSHLQIDHLVPLGDAWAAGASAWSPERRRQYANDLTSPDTLTAVSASSNEAKSDHTPDEWLPPDRASWCGYAGRWVGVKARWGLTVTVAEKTALQRILAGCR